MGRSRVKTFEDGGSLGGLYCKIGGGADGPG